jgi:hypothetical protein
MKRGDYDYNHATSNTQFIALVVILAICVLGGLTLGLMMLTSIL